MTWYIHKGDNLKRDQRIKFEFYDTIRSDYSPDELIFDPELSYSEADTAPKYPATSVKVLCKLSADLRHVDKSSFKKRKGKNGKIYFDVEYDLVVCTTAGHLKFSLEIGGKELGAVEATYV